MSCSHLAHAQWPRNDTDDMTDEVSWEKASDHTTSILPLAEISPLHPPEDSIQLGRLFSSNLLFVSVNIPCFRSQCEPVSVGPFFYPPRQRSVISPVTSF